MVILSVFLKDFPWLSYTKKNVCKKMKKLLKKGTGHMWPFEHKNERFVRFLLKSEPFLQKRMLKLRLKVFFLQIISIFGLFLKDSQLHSRFLKPRFRKVEND